MFIGDRLPLRFSFFFFGVWTRVQHNPLIVCIFKGGVEDVCVCVCTFSLDVNRKMYFEFFYFILIVKLNWEEEKKKRCSTLVIHVVQ